MTENSTIPIATIGAGKMASAIVKGVLAQGIYKPDQIGCVCGNDQTGPELAKNTGIHYFQRADELLQPGQVVLLACKPQQLEQLSGGITVGLKDSLLVSILAGIKLEKLQQHFGDARNIVRCMPNTPGKIGAGVSAFSPLNPLNESDLMYVESILGALGIFKELPEHQLDAVTAISGSGPAYVFELASSMKEAAESAELPSSIADLLTRETILGAAKLLVESNESPEALRDAVTSPGGTTEAALQVLGQSSESFRKQINDAVQASRARSKELS